MYFGSFFKIGAIKQNQAGNPYVEIHYILRSNLISAPFSYFLQRGKRRDDEIKQIEEELESEMENKKSEEKLTQ